jgi:RNA polymerase sigma-70 factor, ECF subfamily
MCANQFFCNRFNVVISTQTNNCAKSPTYIHKILEYLHLTMSEHDNINDIELISLLKSDSNRAFRMLYDRYYAYLLNTAYQYVRDTAAAEDIVHTVFEKIWANLKTLDIRTSLKYYLRMMVVNESINYIKRQKKTVLNEPDEWSALATTPAESEWQVEMEEMENVVRKAIDLLPEKCRVVFMLSRFEKFSHKQISDQLGISTKTIENQITKAMKIIRDIVLKYKELSSIVILCLNMFWGK